MTKMEIEIHKSYYKINTNKIKYNTFYKTS